MNTGWRNLIRFACVATLALLIPLFGCGGSSGSGTQPSSPAISSVSVSCSPSSILITQTATCTSTVAGTGNYVSSVKWSVNPSNIGTISSAGIFTPAAAGTVTITATSTQDTTKSGNTSISAANTTALAISIVDLPAGTPGAVTVTDPNGQKTQVTGSEIITAMPGSYTVAAASVTIDSSAYIAKQQVQTVQVASGSPTAVTVDYYNVIPQTTKVLDSAGMQGIQISSDGTTLTISAASTVAQSLHSGDVLVVPPTGASTTAPMGLLRKVTGVNTGSSVIVVTVAAATLADAFQRLAIQINNESTSTAVQAVHTVPGVIFHPGAKLGLRPLAHSLTTSTSAQDPCGNFSLGVFDITKGISLDPVSGITLEGQVELCSGIDFSADIIGTGFLNLQPELNSLAATATIGEYSDLTLQGEYQLGLFDYGPVTLATVDLEPIPVPGLPIWVTPEVSVFVGANGTISAGFSTQVSEAGSFSGGVTYTSGQWTPVQPVPSLQFSYSPPTLDTSLDAKAYAGAGINLMVWDLIGPSFKPDGYLDFNADIAANPWWNLTGGVEGPMSLNVGFLGLNLANYDLGNMFDYSTVIARASGPFSPSTSAPAIQSLSPSQVAAGSRAFTLDVSGTNFVPGALVNFGTTALTTTWENSAALSAAVPAALVAQAGTIPITVANLGTGAGTSAPVSFTVASGIVLSPATVDVPESEVQTFFAAVPGGGSVNWSVQEGSTGGSITSAGIYTAPVQAGTYHVIAMNTADSTQTATATLNVVPGPSITTLHSFNRATEGAISWAAPMFGSDGYLYGVTVGGGNLSCSYTSSIAGCGTIYKSDTSGNVTTLYKFSGSDGAYPETPLIETSSGTLFGTTEFGGANTSDCAYGNTSNLAGCGTVFSLNSSQSFDSLYSFGPFSSPVGVAPLGLTLSRDGIVYGVSYEGGNGDCSGTLGPITPLGCGAIYTTTGTTTPSVTHDFSGSDGAYPAASLLEGPDGNFYGTTAGGGDLTCSSYASRGCGTVFSMTPTGSVKTLYTFNSGDGAAPEAKLILGSDGNMYGTTLFGGVTTCSGGAQWLGCGTVFKIDKAGNFTLLHSFSGPDGAYPATLMQAADGYFYGTTESGGDASCSGRYGPGCGTLFRMDSAGNVTVLYSFTGQSDGSWPESEVVQGADGNLYGTTAYGGMYDDGVLFRISNLGVLKTSMNALEYREPSTPHILPPLIRNPHVGLPAPSSPNQK